MEVGDAVGEHQVAAGRKRVSEGGDEAARPAVGDEVQDRHQEQRGRVDVQHDQVYVITSRVQGLSMR